MAQSIGYSTRLSNERRERSRRDYRRSLFFPLKEVAVARDNELGVMNAGQSDQVIVFGIPGQWNDLARVGNRSATAAIVSTYSSATGRSIQRRIRGRSTGVF